MKKQIKKSMENKEKQHTLQEGQAFETLMTIIITRICMKYISVDEAFTYAVLVLHHLSLLGFEPTKEHFEESDKVLLGYIKEAIKERLEVNLNGLKVIV